LLSKGELKLFLIIDSDMGGDPTQIKRNRSIMDNFKSNRAWMLNERCIENYYHKDTLARLHPCKEFIIEDNNKVDLKEPKIFIEMTKREWEEVSNGELEAIFDEILQHLKTF
jgi:hypothetical protein